MKEKESYVGIHDDLYGGMTDIGKIIRDAWAFGLIPESETCAGWRAQGIENLWEKVQGHWAKYQFSVRHLPDDVRERYLRIQDEAVKTAKSSGWNAELDVDEE